MSCIPSLDHIIILVPHASLKSLPASLSSAFTIYSGGTHADNKTTNSLVLLKSGVYLEFIAFVEDDVDRKEGHWWGTKTTGSIIDFALTSGGVGDVEGVRRKLAALEDEKEGGKVVVGYRDSKRGGRKRPDGVDVEWDVTFATSSIERGTVPFWCHDVTEREVRVPIESAEGATRHPCRAVGVSKVVLVVASDSFEGLQRVYAKICGKEGVQGVHGEVVFEILQPVAGSSPSSLVLRKAEGVEEKAVVGKNGGIAGIWEVVLAVEGSLPSPIHEKIEDGIIRIGFEKIGD
ncbi:hypothetical protein FKW77_003221 [Venturia effusa]|uniref:Glyoxalase-like domain-containing protein n=1 Tax=Venturia effusa TaxID=50376 RepID=A0A517L6Z8_9PEZI|nr:hypothetical protein FKW77_003221 [Venturia effusa]